MCSGPRSLRASFPARPVYEFANSAQKRILGVSNLTTDDRRIADPRLIDQPILRVSRYSVSNPSRSVSSAFVRGSVPRRAPVALFVRPTNVSNAIVVSRNIRDERSSGDRLDALRYAISFICNIHVFVCLPTFAKATPQILPDSFDTTRLITIAIDRVFRDARDPVGQRICPKNSYN